MTGGLTLRVTNFPFANHWSEFGNAFGGYPTGLQLVSLGVRSDFESLTLGAHTEGARFGEFSSSMVFPFLDGVSYTLRLELDGGLARATVGSPTVWFREHGIADPLLKRASINTLDGALVFSAAGQAFLTNAGGGFNITLPIPLERSSSEIRMWETEAGQRMGMCTPDLHQVSIGQTEISRFGVPRWPFADETSTDFVLGSFTGQGNGEFVFPLTFDRSTDGRIYVLDAGNSRIQSFDEAGAYITQWGNRGSGDGDFDFGAGNDPTDFVGSIVVDDDGFIYVADVGNKRIQKFAP